MNRYLICFQTLAQGADRNVDSTTDSLADAASFLSEQKDLPEDICFTRGSIDHKGVGSLTFSMMASEAASAQRIANQIHPSVFDEILSYFSDSTGSTWECSTIEKCSAKPKKSAKAG